MKRWLSVAVAGLVACGPASTKPTDYPSLDPPPPSAPTAEIPEAPAPDRAEFTAPPSNPSGAPIAITWTTLAAGDRRTRDLTHHALYSSSWDTDSRRQRTTRHFRIGERITKIDDGLITALEAAVEDGEENVELDGKAHPQTLVSGDYLVTVRADGSSIGVSRADSGFPIGDREREEIQGIYSGEIGRDAPLLTVLKGRTLRVGETVELTAEERAIAGGGEGLTVPIHLTLAAVTGGVATFHFAFFQDEAKGEGDDASTDVRGVKLSFGLEVATGRLRTIGVIDARADSSKAMTSTSRMVEETVLSY